MSARTMRCVLGISLDGVTATAAWRAGSTAALQVVRVPCDATPRAILQAFADIARVASGADRVRVTLERPLANARTVEFPPMSRATLERVLERDWARHVIGLWLTAHTASARQAKSGRWRAVFAPTETLEAIAHAAEEHGWRDVRVQSSDDALAATALANTAGDSSTEHFVVVCDDDGPTDAVCVRGGEPFVGRRLLRPAADDDALLFIHTIAGEHAQGASIVVLGPPSRSSSLAKALGQHGHRARVVDVGVAASAASSATIAAAGMIGAPMLELRSPASRAARARGFRGVTGWLLGAAAAALVIAFVIERTAVTAELTSVRTRRADLSGQVRKAMAARREVEAGVGVASVLAEGEAAASRATSVIAAVASALPAGTALTVLSVARDSVTIEGESTRSAAVYEALRLLPQLRQVRLAAPLRQERHAGADAIERFAFSARMNAAIVPAGAKQ